MPPGIFLSSTFPDLLTSPSEGWACDAKKYSTDFRVSVKKSGRTEEELARVIARLPEDRCRSNVGRMSNGAWIFAEDVVVEP